MATASLNIRLSYGQILELARQLSDEDKLQLNRELAAEARRIKLQQLFRDLGYGGRRYGMRCRNVQRGLPRDIPDSCRPADHAQIQCGQRRLLQQ